jgi:NAD(P)-dependent dehydrogenase (short-subunit alcohol dehydrogenase family)
MTTETAVPQFGARSTALEVIAGHDLRGRDAIVTGGASGIGVETVRALASAGARVVLAARNQAVADEVAAALRTETGSGTIEVGLLDLASLASVRAFVARYISLERPLHLLINNAGVMATPQSYTQDGFEMQFGTNHVGHFALMVGLLPALKAAGTARVVALSSIGHRRSDVVFEDLNFGERPYDPWSAYGQSKTANVLFAVGLTQRHAGDGITSNAVMPGGILTGLQKHMTREEQMGASTSIWAAVAPELEGVGGRYLEDCAIAKPWASENPMSGVMPYALDAERAARLWSVSEELIAQ